MVLRISLVIATYNRADSIDRLLTQLVAQTLPRDQWEVIVVDDGSQDHTLQVLRRHQEQDAAKFNFAFFTQKNGGQASARNRGIAAAGGERICICDDDMQLAPTYLVAHLAAAASDPAHLVVLGCLKGSDDWRTKPLYDAVGEFRLETAHRRFASGEWQPVANDMATGNVSLPRQLFLDIGGFDASLRIDEDRELGFRLGKGGAVFAFSPDAWCINKSNIGSMESWQRRQFNYGMLGVQVWEKHHRELSLNPTRALVDGNLLKGLCVLLACQTPLTAKLTIPPLIFLGNLCQRCGMIKLGIMSYQLVASIQYHRGLATRLGSFAKLVTEAHAYRLNRRARSVVGSDRQRPLVSFGKDAENTPKTPGGVVDP